MLITNILTKTGLKEPMKDVSEHIYAELSAYKENHHEVSTTEEIYVHLTLSKFTIVKILGLFQVSRNIATCAKLQDVGQRNT